MWHGNIVFTQYHSMNFSSIIRCDHKIFNICKKVLLNSWGSVIEVTFFHIIVFLKSVVTSSRKNTAINFYAKALKRFPEEYLRGIVDLAFVSQITFSRNFENNWNKNDDFHQTFKIILINENSFLQMYPRWVFSRINSWGLSGLSNKCSQKWIL